MPSPAGQSPTVSFPEERTARARQRLLAAERQIALRLRWATALQVSLELPALMQAVFAEASAQLAVGGLSYRAPGQEPVEFGSGAHHRTSYHLRGEADDLGEIALSRRQRFSEDDLAVLELLLGSLILPLRNALRYQALLASSESDSLTGMGNRRALDAALERDAALAERHDQPFSLLVVDVDHFKTINDRYGHRAGDISLQAVSTALRNSCRTTDEIYRYGGEEFVILLPHTDATGATAMAERVRRAAEALEIAVDGGSVRLTVSAGVAERQVTESGSATFQRADRALYAAKAGGRNRVELAGV